MTRYALGCLLVTLILIGGCSDGESVPSDEVQEVRGVERVPVDPGLLSALRGEVDALPTATPTPVATVAPPTPEPAPLPELTDIQAVICSYSWPCETAIAVACSESELWPLAENPSGARGVFQLMPVHAWRFAQRGWDYWTDWSDPEKNIAIAHELWADQGWTPWLSSYPWGC